MYPRGVKMQSSSIVVESIFKEISVESRFNHGEPLNESRIVTSRFNIWDTENTDRYESSDLHRIDRQRLYRSHRHELRATKHDRLGEWNIKQTCSRHDFVICRLVISERRRMFPILFHFVFRRPCSLL